MQESRCKVIAITNQKGGGGKTTTTFNLGVALAKQGKKVLIVDVDSQSNLSTYAGWYNEEDLSRGQIRNDEVEVFEREKEISIHNTINEHLMNIQEIAMERVEQIVSEMKVKENSANDHLKVEISDIKKQKEEQKNVIEDTKEEIIIPEFAKKKKEI